MKNQKFEALMTAAWDFYRRGEGIQYDQKSMDRIVQLTPRRRKFLPPEAGTDQYTLYLDCSGFCFDAYYQAFGYELPSDLTWIMADMVEPRIYYYEKTFKETKEEQEKIIADIKACLEPGDLIILQHQGHSGHVMLYMGDNRYMNCRPETAGLDDSYDYDKGENHHRSTGGIYIDDAELLFHPAADGSFGRYYLFSQKETRIAIARPLDRVGEITPQMQVRMGEYKGLWSAVESSHCGGRHAVPGETVRYSVTVRNMTEDARDVKISFKAPSGSKQADCGSDCGLDFGYDGMTVVCEKIQGKDEKTVYFEVIVEETGAYRLDAPEVTVNGLKIYAQPVLLGKAVSAEENSLLISEAEREISGGADAVRAAAKAYGMHGIHMDSRAGQHILTHFYLHDSTAGDVLSRRPQCPYEDMAVYSFFGGRGVVTPEMGSSTGIRTTHVKTSDLMAGDIILCSDDPYGKDCYSSLFTGESLMGTFEAGGKVETISGEDADRFVDGLFARFCFIILRPWLTRHD